MTLQQQGNFITTIFQWIFLGILIKGSLLTHATENTIGEKSATMLKENLLCLDIGNSDMLVGLYEQDHLKFTLRYDTQASKTEDELGLFLIEALRYNAVPLNSITGICMSSVVPRHNRTTRAMGAKYFPQVRFFELNSETCGKDPRFPLKISYKNAQEVGSDLIANAIGGTQLYPKQNLIIIDMGTATTICAITKEPIFLGAAILPGMNACANALHTSTALLPHTQAIKASTRPPIGTHTTNECIQAGLYYGQLGSLKEIIMHIQEMFFKEEPAVVIATGGWAYLFEDEKLFTSIEPTLILKGMKHAFETTL